MPFASAKKNVRRNTLKSISLESFCSWQMAWAKEIGRSVELQMADTIVVWNGSIENVKEFQTRLSKSQWNGFIMLINDCVKNNQFFNQKKCQLIKFVCFFKKFFWISQFLTNLYLFLIFSVTKQETKCTGMQPEFKRSISKISRKFLTLMTSQLRRHTEKPTSQRKKKLELQSNH